MVLSSPLRSIGDLDLTATDGGRAAHAALPEAAEGVAELGEENEIDIMRGGKLHRVGREERRRADEDALNLVRGNGQFLAAGRDNEAVAFFS